MKKLFSIALFAVMVLGWGATFAQCNIVIPNTNPGLTPASPGVITQGTAYTQTQQVYVPATYSGNGIDSVHVSSITGLPAGITYSFNPVDGGGGTVNGGSNGAICFAGTTTAAAGKYPLTFNGDAYVVITGVPGVQTVPLSAAPLLADTFVVQAAPPTPTCDTIINQQSPLDTPFIFTAGVTADSGYVSGNNIYGDLAKAEGFGSVIGDAATSAFLFFGEAAVNAGDSNNTLTVYVWDNTGTDDNGNPGAPGNAIDSATVTLRQIAYAVTLSQTVAFTPVEVNFTHNVALTTDTFYVGVVLPTATGDTVALYTNFGPDGDGWEFNVGTPNVWGNYVSDWGFTGGNVGNYIAVGLCGNAPIAHFGINALSGCTPFTANFTDASVNSPTSYSWSFGDGGTASTASPSHTYTTAGTYTVVENVSATGGSSSSSAVVTVNAGPTATANVGPGTASLVLTGNSPYTYIWSNGATTASISGVTANNYIVTVTDANGCTLVDTVDVTFGTGIINLGNASTVKIYPNPATDVLNLVWSQKSNAEVSIVDLNGNVISTVITNGDMKTVYDIHNLSSGNYIVRITDKTSNQQQSLLFSKF